MFMITCSQTPSKPRPSTYSCQPVPRGSKAFGVYITYVKSPSRLCVQLIREDTTQALDSLHEDMFQFYSGKAGDCSSIDNPTIGQVGLEYDTRIHCNIFIYL